MVAPMRAKLDQLDNYWCLALSDFFGMHLGRVLDCLPPWYFVCSYFQQSVFAYICFGAFWQASPEICHGLDLQYECNMSPTEA